MERLADEIHLPAEVGSEELSVRYAPSPAGALCLLYLHGFGSHQSGEKAEFFRQGAADLGVSFCSFDFRGHGRSGGTMRGLTLTRNLRDIERVLELLALQGEKRIVFLGSSMGAGSALWYAALHPGIALAALHLAPALELEKSLLTWAGPERTAAWQRTGVLAFHNEFVKCELGWELIEDLRRYPVGKLHQLQATSTLLLQGQRDDQVPWKGVVDLWAASHGSAELHLFADGDHRLTDRKERLWSLMVEFLEARGLLSGPNLRAGSRTGK
jgi:pimeloyl-ACP methyl ester carboxylesterase